MPTRTFTLHTPLDDTPDQLNVTIFHGYEALSTDPEFQVECFSSSANIDPTKLLGQSITLEMQTQNVDTPRYLNGLATKFTYIGPDGSAERRYRYRLQLNSWLHLAEIRTDCKIFQHKTVPTIIQETLQELGMPFEMKLIGTYPEREYCVQFQESKLNFVKRLAEAVGIYFYVKHSLGAHTIVFTDGVHGPLPGAYEEIQFLTPGKLGLENEEYITEWSAEHKVTPGRYQSDSYDFKNPNEDLTNEQDRPMNHSHDGIEVYEWTGAYVDNAVGRKFAAVRHEQEQHDYQRITVTSNLRGIAPGFLFTLTKHPRSDYNTKYLIISANYQFAESADSTNATNQGTTWDITFTVRPSVQRYYHPRTTQKVRVIGPHTAKVSGPAGREIWTDVYGRVVVQFPWDRYGKNDENSSCFIRVSSPWAGSNFGGVFIPRIKQEVLVEYINGDIDLPVITGRVYNQWQMPPWDLPANATQSGILSRSSEGGRYANANAIRFEDKKGAEQVWIQAERNMDTVVENDETHHVMHDRTKTIDHDETVFVHHDRTETVDNNETITVHNNRQERVDVNETISIGANRTEDVGIDETISIGANKTLTIGANKVQSIAISYTQNVGAAKMTNVGGAYLINVGAAMNRMIGLVSAEEVGLSKITKVGVSQSVTVAKDQKVEIGNDQSVSVGKNITITAGDSIELVCGKSTLKMTKDGHITINGHELDIGTSGNQILKADGDINFKAKNIEEN